LFYGKAGAAWAGATYGLAGVENVGAFATTLGGTFSHMRTGWTVGTGLEWAWTQNWTVKLEYDYINLGTASETVPVGGITAGGLPYGGTVAANVSQSISEVKFGINYKLSPGFLFW
jgi:outer membrane immunogenic protein